ncbi:MAG: hypothetical protein QGI06_14575 [Rhodospirillales bacterium]|jgi:hypothetical protein|nr:hypothetical protein [Rhodospirillales bacterium]
MRPPDERRSPDAVDAAYGASDLAEAGRIDKPDDKLRPANIQALRAGDDRAGGDQVPGPAPWRSLGYVVDGLLADTARRAIAHHLDSVVRGAPAAVAEANAIRMQMSWASCSQVVGADIGEVAP